jgi:hypothetical protein
MGTVVSQDHPVFGLGSQAEAGVIVAWVARELRDPNSVRPVPLGGL